MASLSTRLAHPTGAPTTDRLRRAAWPRRLPLLGVLLAYVAAALVVPTLANVAVTDDWVYYRAVETLLAAQRLEVPQMSAASLVFQTVWGAAFALVLGLSFGTLRIATLVIVGLGGLAFYALCRELRLSRGWSTLGAAALLFQPLVLALAFTFMTDPYFLALLIVSSWLYLRGVREGAPDRDRWLLAGSVAASCAFLVRQQGLLIPLGVLVAAALSRRLSPRLALLVGAVPLLTAVGYTLWLRFANGTPWAMTLFWSDLAAAGGLALLGFVPRLVVLEGMYVGFFALPIAVAALPALGSLRPRRRLAASWATVLLVGAIISWFRFGQLMPYVGQFVGYVGIGPQDVVADRPVLLSLPTRAVLTLVCLLASVLAVCAVAQRCERSRRFFGTGIGLAICIGAGQALGTMPPSIHFIDGGGSLDRYLLPLVPFSLALLLWALGGRRVSLPLAWLVVGLLGLWAVAGTRDYLVFLDSVWSLAESANASGIPNTQLDAGAGWDGFHLYQQPPPNAVPWPGQPWWIELFAPSTDSTYIIAGAELPGFTVVDQRSYRSWLQGRSLPLYLERRATASSR